ncbi:hypothetical protein LCGC14_1554430, partial [marine sediment metagenome]
MKLGFVSAILPDIHVIGGNLKSLASQGDVNANVEVEVGNIGKFAIKDGSFGNPVVDMAVRTMTGIGSFDVRGGDIYGLISTDGYLKSLRLSDTGGQGILFGRIRAGDGIGTVRIDWMNNAIISSATDINRVSIANDMDYSTIVSGMDLADAGFDALNGGELPNVQFDGRTILAWQTPGNADIIGGGNVNLVDIGRTMHASSISGATGPGRDGWFGTADDEVRSTGVVKLVKVGGAITGTPSPTEHYAIVAASGMPNVISNPTFVNFGNVSLSSQAMGVGSPQIVDVLLLTDRIIIYFDHDIDFETINTGMNDPTRPTTLSLVVSQNSYFGPAESDDVSISDEVPHTLSYNEADHSVTLKLDLVVGTFLALNKGANYLLTVNADVVADRRGNLLDGEFRDNFPTGDGLSGGDFAYRFIHGDAGDTVATANNLTGT